VNPRKAEAAWRGERSRPFEDLVSDPKPVVQLGEDVDALMLEDSRLAARLVVPFLVPTLGLLWVVLGSATHAFSVRVAFGAALAAVAVRWVALRLLARPGTRAWTPLRRKALFTSSSWLSSAAFAGIHVSGGLAASTAQLLMMAIIATAVCTLAILSAPTSLFTYVGYVAINLVSLTFVMVWHPDAESIPLLPPMVLFFMVALGFIAKRNNASVREKTELAMKVRDFGLRDALTGLRNRAFAEVFTGQRATQLAEQWALRGRRKGAAPRSLALLLVDLDHFKQVNDKYGHSVGDQVLVAFGMVARAAVRSGDIVARWGGEEFLVVMEVDDRASAHVVAERLRQMIATTPVAMDGSDRTVAMTCSIGACLYPFDPARPADLTWQETLEMADASLYKAKASGRNRTTWSRPDPDFAPRQLLEFEREGEATTAVFRKVAVRKVA
jgi:diguanylate cyclase (GGDEF)-like protein